MDLLEICGQQKSMATIDESFRELLKKQTMATIDARRNLTNAVVVTKNSSESDFVISKNERIVEMTILITILLVAFVGNVSLWIIIRRDRRLHSTANWLVLCLSGADILVSSINMPFIVYNLSQGGWVLSNTTCVVLGFLSMLAFVTSVMSLASISWNRYLLICRNQRYQNVYTATKTKFIIAGTWMFAATLASPPLLGWGQYAYLPGQSICFCQWRSSVSYTFFMVSVCFGGPCSIMSFSYAKILQEVRKSKQRLAKKPNTRTKITGLTESRPSTDVQSSNSAGAGKKSSDESASGKDRKRQEELKLTLSFLVVIMSFIILWLPFCVTMFISVFSSKRVPRVPDMTTMLLGCFNSCCNPVIYGIMNTKFRVGFMKLYCWPCRKTFKGAVFPGEMTVNNI